MKFKSTTFKDEKIELDFNVFDNCIFNDCQLIYRGYGPLGLSGCTFNNATWTFEAAAAQTIQFLSGLYNGAGPGGKQLVEKTFDSIRMSKAAGEI